MRKFTFIRDLKKGEGEICARVVASRKQGGIIFIDVADHTGKVQVVVEKKSGEI